MWTWQMVARRGLAVAAPTALGVLSIMWSGSLAQQPAAKDTLRTPPQVRVITMAPMDIIPRVSGYGTVEPAREWRAVARIEGEIDWTIDGLAPGLIVGAGTSLARIDDSGLRLSLAQTDAQLAALEVKDQTIAASMALVQSDLELAQADLTRQEKLAQQGVVTAASLESVRRQELAARSKLVETQNQIALNAAERDVLRAQRATLERDLGFADIRTPYDLRLTDVSAEIGQYVARGQTLLAAEGTEAVEIAAQFPIGRIGPLMRAMAEGSSVTDLTARIRLPAADHSVTWKAQVVRMGESIDPRTQSSAIVVRAEDPLSQAEAGARPPLRRNMLVEVVLSAPKTSALVAPLDAVVGGSALVVSEEGKLEKRPVTLGFTLDEIAVVTEGLAEGDKLVVADPSIAVPGMAVKPLEDKATLAALAAAATGGTAGKGKGASQ